MENKDKDSLNVLFGLTTEQIMKVATLAKALKEAGLLDLPSTTQPSKPSTRSTIIRNPEANPFSIKNPICSSNKTSSQIPGFVKTDGFDFNEAIAEIHESKTFSVHISRQTERYSGRCYIVLTKIRDGEFFRKFTIPVGLAHSIAFYLEQSSKKYGDRTPRPIHIDDFF